MTPEQADVTPEQTHLTPEQIDVTPEHIDVTPEQTHVTPEHIDVTPEQTHVAPERRYLRTELPVLPEPRLDLLRPDVAEAARLGALVGDPVRAGILAILRDGPHCVCEMAAALDVRQNNLSNHLAKLRESGLVRASRHQVDARWVYYERDEEAVSAALAALREVLG